MSVVTLDANKLPSVLNVRINGKLRRYVPERTCHADLVAVVSTPHEIRRWECSSCGGSFEDAFGEYEYCPRCGARIIAEVPDDRP